jgi:hypothetical protein
MYDDVGDVGDDTVSPVEDYKAGKCSVISAAGLCVQAPPIKGWYCNLAVRANGLRRARMGRGKPCCVARKRLGYQSNASFHLSFAPSLSKALLPRTVEYSRKCLRSGNRPRFGHGTKLLRTNLDLLVCSCQWDCMVSLPHTCKSCSKQRRPGVYMAVFSLSALTMHWDGKRFSGVRWVVTVTCVLCRFRCRSTNHIFQLCGRHPIRGCNVCV